MWNEPQLQGTSYARIVSLNGLISYFSYHSFIVIPYSSNTSVIPFTYGRNGPVRLLIGRTCKHILISWSADWLKLNYVNFSYLFLEMSVDFILRLFIATEA